MRVRRAKSESTLFGHSWDYAPVVVPWAAKELQAIKLETRKRSSNVQSSRGRRRVHIGQQRSSSSQPSLDTLESLLAVDELARSKDNHLVSAPKQQLFNYLFLSATSVEDVRMVLRSYEQIVAPTELFDNFFSRYMANPLTSSVLENGQLARYRDNIVRAISLWIAIDVEAFLSGADESPPELALFPSFMSLLATTNTLQHRTLSAQLVEAERTLVTYRTANFDLAPTPLMNLKQNFSSVLLYEMHPQEVARQLTLLDHPTFLQLEIAEVINCAWMKPDAQARSPNVVALVKAFNNISFWIATEIVSSPNKKQRVTIVHWVFKLAKHLHELHNYHALMAIYAALHMFQLQRLTATWADVPKADLKYFKSLDRLFDSKGNYAALRKEVAAISAANVSKGVAARTPVMPFHGIFLRAFVGINENPTTTREGHINLVKLSLVADQQQLLRNVQDTPYCLIPVAQILHYLTQVMQYNAGEALLTSLSKQCESRKKEADVEVKRNSTDKGMKTKTKSKEKQKKGFLFKL
eukprot:TRINITY_DN8635_c0_g1_i1.p1 TRINITY_DN8635_c0_g1~~TRINITY_DN8635_c0_g1_i1.p1  ORF type:complete len:524 (+),score=92.60 TRINITY_DN8635_c0_g1_i1:261-1832(+)